jgi:hypothetical protein
MRQNGGKSKSRKQQKGGKWMNSFDN